jgi:hypothetical protein
MMAAPKGPLCGCQVSPCATVRNLHYVPAGEGGISMMLRTLLLASAVGLLCIGAPALGEPPIGSRLGKRLSTNEEKREREAALGAHEMARCLVNKQRSVVRAFLSSVDAKESERLSKEMSGEHECMSMTEGNDLVEGRMVTFPHDIYRGMLSEWMIKNDERTFSSLPALPRQLTYSRSWYAVSDRDASVNEMATCVSENAPHETLALLKTLPYSDAEGSAFAAVVPSMGACLRVGVKLTGNRQSLRAALADALYQRIANPAPMPAPPVASAKAQ